MQRISKIKWRDIDEARLRREVKNYNAKINRILKKDPGAVEYLPAKKSLAAEREKAKSGTRKEFEFQSKWTRAFSEKGGEKLVTNQLGAKVTTFELKYAKELVRRENIKKGLKRSKADERIRKGFGDPEKEFEKRKKKLVFETKTQKEFDLFVSALEKKLSSQYDQETLELFKANYLKGLGTLGPLAESLLERLKSLDVRKFYEAATSSPEMAIQNFYAPEDAMLIAELLNEQWNKYL